MSLGFGCLMREALFFFEIKWLCGFRHSSLPSRQLRKVRYALARVIERSLPSRQQKWAIDKESEDFRVLCRVGSGKNRPGSSIRRSRSLPSRQLRKTRHYGSTSTTSSLPSRQLRKVSASRPAACCSSRRVGSLEKGAIPRSIGAGVLCRVGSLENHDHTKELRAAVLCRVGSLENLEFHHLGRFQRSRRVGSLEKSASLRHLAAAVLCRVGSLENHRHDAVADEAAYAAEQAVSTMPSNSCSPA